MINSSARYAERYFLPEVLKLESPVIHGFGRGSKLLGIPTANLNMDIVGEAVDLMKTGIYFGYSRVRESTFESVISVGWNPFFNNSMKAIESHILHTFDSDFYEENLQLYVCGYLRSEETFNGIDELIQVIRDDIELSRVLFQSTELRVMMQASGIDVGS